MSWYDPLTGEIGFFCKSKTFTSYIQKQCWTEGQSSTAVAEDLRPTATATVAEV